MTTEGEQQIGRCWECGYSLRGLPTPRCPECGRAFDPNNPITMNMGTEIGPIARWLMRPPGWPLHVFTVLAILASLWTAATPTGPGQLADIGGWLISDRTWKWSDLLQQIVLPGSILGRYLIAGGLWLGIALWWIARRLARGVTVKRTSKQRAATFAYWRRWLITPALLAITLLICMTYLPVYAGFWLSKRQLDDVVKQARVARRSEFVQVAHAIGIYPPTFNRPRRTGILGGMSGFVAQHAQGETWIWMEDNGAFIYRDDGKPPDVQSSRFRNGQSHGRSIVHHLSGGWYSVEFGRYGEF